MYVTLFQDGIMGLDDSFHEGLKAFRDGRYQEAIQLLHESVAANEQNHKAWNALGVTYTKLGELENALNCYENALKYDPGNLSYEQNRDQIVKKAFKKINPPEEDRIPEKNQDKQTNWIIPYQKYLIPSAVLILVVILAIFLLVIPSFTGNPNVPPSHSQTPVQTVVPESTPISSGNETQTNNSNESTTSDNPNTESSTGSGGQQPSLVIRGDLNGKYTKGLSELTFTIILTDGSQPQYLPRVSYLWSAGTMDPITVLPANPASGTIKPGDEQEVTLQIPAEQQPRGGEKFSLEIRPPTGLPAFYSMTLPDNYRGGIITNPLSGNMGYSSSGSTQSGVPVSSLVVDDSVNGFYSGELEELSFTLREQATGSPQDISDITYMLSVNDGTPVKITKKLPASGTINPGEQQLVTLSIPEDYRPRGGDTFTLDIKPDNGSSVQIRKTLSSAYKGGIIA
ncbi:hypothetical protein DK846_05000 [Methanospirillum lacunae]|uniref:Uncharacterized protein n=2 Tax=Methanospirillum lacunae TaxID=668570 RepID=A0A2V2N9N5_9EURY|nr:hypothetical protein DK846_05000 [Methanospirillum lacunae]